MTKQQKKILLHREKLTPQELKEAYMSVLTFILLLSVFALLYYSINGTLNGFIFS